MHIKRILNEINISTGVKKGANWLVDVINSLTGGNTKGFKLPGEYEKRIARRTQLNWDKIISEVLKKRNSNKLTVDEIKTIWDYFENNVIQVQVPAKISRSIINLTEDIIQHNSSSIRESGALYNIFHKLIVDLISNGIKDANKSKNEPSQNSQSNDNEDDKDDNKYSQELFKPGNIKNGDKFTIDISFYSDKNGELIPIVAFTQDEDTWYSIKEPWNNGVYGLSTVIPRNSPINNNINVDNDKYNVPAVRVSPKNDNNKDHFYFQLVNDSVQETVETTDIHNDVYFLARLRDRIVIQDCNILINESIEK